MNDWDIAPAIEHGPFNHERCQQMYLHLLKLTEKGAEPASYVALLARTKRCDSLSKDLSRIRQAYHDTMEEWNKGSYYRVLKDISQISDADREAAYRATEDYDSWTAKELQTALSPKNRLFYHWYRIQRTLNQK